jgi:hypothetical protein
MQTLLIEEFSELISLADGLLQEPNFAIKEDDTFAVCKIPAEYLKWISK